MGRPGKSEPDFVFYPQDFGPLSSFGVIELKRPSSKLVSRPRKNIIKLAGDASTAVAQVKRYSQELQRRLITSPKNKLIIGTQNFMFIIAGLADELIHKQVSLDDHMVLMNELPANCQIIPYDYLLESFDQSIPPSIMYLEVVQPQSLFNLNDGELEELARVAKEALSAHSLVSNDNIDFWLSIQERWTAGNFIGSNYMSHIRERKYYHIFGTDEVDLESFPKELFRARVEYFVQIIETSLQLHSQLNRIQDSGFELNDSGKSAQALKNLLSDIQLKLINEAVTKCRGFGHNSTWFDDSDPNTDLFMRIGLIGFSSMDAGDVYYCLDSMLLEFWNK